MATTTNKPCAMTAPDCSAEVVEHVCAAFQVMLGRYQTGAIERELFTSAMEKLRALAARVAELERERDGIAKALHECILHWGNAIAARDATRAEALACASREQEARRDG